MDHQLFVIVIPVLLNPVIIAMTFPLVMVHDPGVYSTLAEIVLFIVNVVLTLLPATSVMTSVYVPSFVIVVPLVRGSQFSVAVAPVRLSTNVIVISALYVFPSANHEYVGRILSIVNVAELEFPASSITSKV